MNIKLTATDLKLVKYLESQQTLQALFTNLPQNLLPASKNSAVLPQSNNFLHTQKVDTKLFYNKQKIKLLYIFRA